MKQPSNLVASNEARILSLAVLGVTIALFLLVRNLVIALILAAIFAAVFRPVFCWIQVRLGNRSAAASLLTLMVLGLIVIMPSLVLVQLLAVDTLAFAARVQPMLRDEIGLLEQPEFAPPDWLPFSDQIEAALPKIRESAAQLLSHIGAIILTVAKNATLNTLKFLIELLIFLYAMFFFLQMEQGGLPVFMRYTGLPESTRKKLADRIAAVGGSTIRGTIAIGLVQGVLLGIGLYFAGFSHILYLSAIGALCSALPAVGVVLVWGPAVVYLLVTGDQSAAFMLFLWNGLVTSMADNVLRPVLVGRETNISGVMVLVTTLGGLATIGASAIILGPVLAGVFLTLWQEYLAKDETAVSAGAAGERSIS